MIKINFRAPRTAQWKQWRKDCKAALTALKRQKKPPYIIDDKLYKECREIIVAAYHGKCAYCEGRLREQSQVDVEHFRPKGGVRDLKNQIVRVGKDPHPGYWWLAYEPSNLLPSCSMCNKYTRKYGGKGERFPLRENEFRASKPGDEKREKCLLIHPGLDKNPSSHFDIDSKTGGLKSLDDRGRATIEVMGLNREALMMARRQAGMEATLYLGFPGKLGKEYKGRITDQLKGRLPYSFVWRRLAEQTAKKKKGGRALGKNWS